PTTQPNRITLEIPPCPRLIIPKVVVVQTRLYVEVLPREAQIERNRLGTRREFAKHVHVAAGITEVAPLPHDGIACGRRPRLDGATWGTELVGLDVIDLAAGCVGNRKVVQIDVFALYAARRCDVLAKELASFAVHECGVLRTGSAIARDDLLYTLTFS